jgi:hypothetical protein
MLSKREYLKAWRRKNAGRVAAYESYRHGARHKQKYGISIKERNTLLRLQGYRCAGCRKKKDGHWNTDHCHRTQKVRGVLCRPCNLALGFASDTPSTLRRLADYLEKVH